MKIAFSDFWPGWDDRKNFLVSILRDLGIDFEIVDDDADVLIASCFGFSWKEKKAGKRIYWTGENWHRVDDPLAELEGRELEAARANARFFSSVEGIFSLNEEDAVDGLYVTTLPRLGLARARG